jgi:drug/metabolite transporter (DMT)-like permease
MTVQLGLLLALACAFATNLAFLWKHRGAVEAPAVDMRHPGSSARGLFTSKWWTVGFSVALGAWALHVAALALAPISLVQAVISGGLVFLAVIADRWFGFNLGRREWMGVALTAIGLAFLGLTVQTGSGGSHSSYSISGMIAFEGAMIFIGALLLISHRVEGLGHHRGLLLGAAAGILFGVSDISIKALTGTVPGDFLSIISPWTLVAIAASVAAFFASARGLQVGEGISVIAFTSVSANLSAILGGILVFGDPMGGDAFEIVARGMAFAMVLVATALMPAPMRAAERTA